MEPQSSSRKYEFNWDLMGTDLDSAREQLGTMMSMEAYRLFQFTMRDVLEQHYGTEAADDIFRESGVLAGRNFYHRYCSAAGDINELAKIVQDKFREMAMGIVRFEKVDLENLTFQLTVDEDLDCSGLPDTNDQICVYDEGFIKGLLDAFTGRDFQVREIDCWCSGERTCRFSAHLTGDESASTANA
jgi:Predicted hydrocarbon binding protein (contains V4R domain)